MKIMLILRRGIKGAGLLVLAALVALQPVDLVNATSLPSIINNGLRHYIPGDVCEQGLAVPNDGSVDASKAQEENAKIVIGIAKTYNLGREGALIGLMTALTESGLKNYANTGVPLSLQHPNKQAEGRDHDSLGIMQQRVSTGWSTFGNGQTKDIVWQLMDPAYAAQAFFGTPPGAKLPDGLKQPSALKKGLQNIGDWRSMDPGAAAQKVQISAFPDAYNRQKNRAQSLLDQYWDAAQPVPLPIPITGGSAPEGVSNEGCTSVGGGDIIQTIALYAWPKYHDAPYYNMKPEYAAAIKKAQSNNEYVGGCTGGTCHPGIDCGGFVTRVMRDSGADPEYNKYEGNTVLQKRYLDENPDKYKKMTGIRGTDGLEPGDIGMTDGHTYFYIGDAIPSFDGNSASSSIGPRSWRTPMASGMDDSRPYTWYRLIK